MQYELFKDGKFVGIYRNKESAEKVANRLNGRSIYIIKIDGSDKKIIKGADYAKN